MQITDRAKDVIKSGGEWISSIDIENLAVGHPDVAEAAVIASPIRNGRTARCSDRRAKEGKHPNTAEVLAFSKAASQMVDARRHADGHGNPPHRHCKINKLRLREAFKDYKLPTG